MLDHTPASSRSLHRTVTIGGEPVEALRARFGAAPFARHYHETPTIGLVRTGANCFRHGARTSTAGEGEMCIVDPGEVHDGGRAGIAWSYDCVLPSAALMQRLATAGGFDSYPWFTTSRLASAQAWHFEAFFQETFAPEPDAELCEELAVNALEALITRTTAARARPLDPCNALALRAIEFIEDNLSVAITLRDIAAAAGANSFSVIRAVARQTGLTPRQLILQKRTDRARQRILAGARIADAAQGCGFSDQAHLSRELRKRWGVTPGVFARTAHLASAW